MVNIGNMYGPDFTFLGIPRCDLDKPESYKGADVIIVGAPIDSGTSYRSGAKMGPQAIRMGDYLPHDAERPHLSMRIDPLQKLKIFDAGDLLMPGGDLVSSLKVLEAATEKISKAGAIAVVLGGDHSIASADVTGIANHLGRGKVSMIHFDAHADTGEDQFGALIGHGTPMRRLIESGSVRGDRFLQLGLRGYWPDDATLKWMAGKGMMIGRWFGTYLLPSLDIDQRLKLIVAIQGLSFLVFWASDIALVSFIALFFVGFGTSMQFALSTLRLLRFGANKPDLAIGKASWGAGIAIALSPFFLGFLADKFGIVNAFLMVPAIVICAFVIVVLLPSDHEVEKR